MSGGIVAEKSSVCRRAGSIAMHAPDVVDEAHVEHPVGLVEDEASRAAERDEALRA